MRAVNFGRRNDHWIETNRQTLNKHQDKLSFQTSLAVAAKADGRSALRRALPCSAARRLARGGGTQFDVQDDEPAFGTISGDLQAIAALAFRADITVGLRECKCTTRIGLEP